MEAPFDRLLVMYIPEVDLVFVSLPHPVPKNRSRPIIENPPTSISAAVRFITKYMPRVRRLLFFIKRMIDRRFTVTIATDSIRNTANQALHSDKEIFFFASHLLISLSFSIAVLPIKRIRIKFSHLGK